MITNIMIQPFATAAHLNVNGQRQRIQHISDMREACDRCHNLRSRCIKPRSSAVCLRCQKLGLSCTHSPPLRLGRPKGKSRNRKRGDRVSSDNMSQSSVDVDDGISEKSTSHPLPRAIASDEVEDETCLSEQPASGRQNKVGQMPQPHPKPQCLDKTLDDLDMAPNQPQETVLPLQEHSPSLQGDNVRGYGQHDAGWMGGIQAQCKSQSPDALKLDL